MRRIGILGCGNIARLVAQQATDLNITAVYDRHADRRSALAALTSARDCNSCEALLREDFDLLLEVASTGGVDAHALPALEAGKDLVLLSTGALLDDRLRQRLEASARRQQRKIYLPSGAIAGVDLIRTGRTAAFSRLLLRTTKPPAALGADVTQRTCLFRGTAAASVRQFHRNINVAATLSIASGNPVEVEIWADPGVSHNQHEVVVEGAFGRAELRVENHPSPDNPKTSYLAALSVITLLRNLDNAIVLGA